MDNPSPTFPWAEGQSKGERASSFPPASLFGSWGSKDSSVSPELSVDVLEPFPEAADERTGSASATSASRTDTRSNICYHGGDGNVAANVERKRGVDHESSTSWAPDDIPVISRRQKKRKGLPKRPLSAYHLYFQRQREDILESGADELDGKTPSFVEMEKLIGKRWKNLPTDEREEFERLAADDSHRYRTEMEAFNDEKKSRVGEMKAPPSSKQQTEQHQKKPPQIQRQDEEVRQHSHDCPLPPPHKPPSHLYRGLYSPARQGRPEMPPMYGVGYDIGSDNAPSQYSQYYPPGYEHYPHAYVNPPNLMNAQSAPHYLSDSSRVRSDSGNHLQLPASGPPSQQYWGPPSYHAEYTNDDNEGMPPPPPSKAARPHNRSSPRSSAAEVPRPPHYMMGHSSRTSEDNLFPIPPGMELLLPDRNGRERKYRVEYTCYTMTREAAQEYMNSLGATPVPRQHYYQP